MVNRISFSSFLQIWYAEVRISRSISESPLEFEITRVDCIWTWAQLYYAQLTRSVRFKGVYNSSDLELNPLKHAWLNGILYAGADSEGQEELGHSHSLIRSVFVHLHNRYELENVNTCIAQASLRLIRACVVRRSHKGPFRLLHIKSDVLPHLTWTLGRLLINIKICQQCWAWKRGLKLALWSYTNSEDPEHSQICTAWIITLFFGMSYIMLWF